MVFTPDVLRDKVRIKDKLTRNLLAEAFGTFLLIFIGLAIVAQFILDTHKTHNTLICVNIGWGFAIWVSVQSVAKLSGGHLNPAVSLMMYTFGKLSFIHFLLYSGAQCFGAFLGALATYITYYDKINGIDPNRTVTEKYSTAGIFSTYPTEHVSMLGAFIDQAVGTGILCLCIALVIDKRNKIPAAAHPLLFGFAVIMIGTAFGLNVGYPINPARDLAPRIFTYFIYGSQVFTHPYPSWFLVPVLGPLVGAVIGGWSYHFFAGAHIPDEKGDYLSVAQEDRTPIKEAA